MKENSLFDRAKEAVGKVAPVVQVVAESALKEAGRNIWEQRNALAKEFTSEIKANGVLDAVVVKPLARQRDIFNLVDHREAIMAGLIGGLIGIVDHLRSKKSSRLDLSTQ